MRKVCGVGINDLKGWCTTEISPNYDVYKRRVYCLWKDMLRRCYGKDKMHYNPTYKDCTVCERWLIFSNFVKDLPKIRNYDLWLNNPDKRIALDKDILRKNNKIYCLEYCMFVTIEDNTSEMARRTNHRSRKSLGKRCKCINLKTGEEKMFNSLTELCDHYGLNIGTISKKIKNNESYKGYLVEYLD